MKPPTFSVFSSGVVGTLMNTKRLPVMNLVCFPSLLRIFSKIRDERRTQPNLTRADSMSLLSQEIGISEIQSLVDGLSVPSWPLRMKGFLYTATGSGLSD